MKMHEPIRLIAVLLAVLFTVWMAEGQSLNAQTGCEINGVQVQVEPTTPLQFQFFPMGLLGIGSGGNTGGLEGFSRFGITFTRSSSDTGSGEVNVKISLFLGNRNLFSRDMEVTLTIPNNGIPYFVSVPQFINGNIPMNLYPTAPRKPRIDDKYAQDLMGGMPSGNFRFEIYTAKGGSLNYQLCGSITVEVTAGATVDLIMPAKGEETSGLPFFQWAAVGGNKFQLTIARLKAGQTEEDALRTSSQRTIIELVNTRSYQSTAGGPVTSIENNLTWNPGLLDGQYCYQVTMIQEDPITGSRNLVNSVIHNFVVTGSGKQMSSGLNTQEILNIVASRVNINLQDPFKGFNAVSIEINGSAATVEDLRAKVNNLPEKFKVEIKP